MHYGPSLESFLDELPQLDTPFTGYQGWGLDPAKHQTTFVRVDGADGDVFEHAHALQFGVLLAGEATLTVAGETWELVAGDTYLIPEGVLHSSVPQAGVVAIEIFGEPNRHKLKA